MHNNHHHHHHHRKHIITTITIANISSPPSSSQTHHHHHHHRKHTHLGSHSSCHRTPRELPSSLLPPPTPIGSSSRSSCCCCSRTFGRFLRFGFEGLGTWVAAEGGGCQDSEFGVWFLRFNPKPLWFLRVTSQAAAARSLTREACM